MNNSITCPSCGHSFDVGEAFSKHVAKDIKKELEKTYHARLSKEKETLTLALQEEQQVKIQALEEENAKKKQENRMLREKEIHILKQEEALKEKEENLALQTEKKLLEGKKEIEAHAQHKAQEQFALEKMQLQKQIDDNKKLAEEMKRKAEQGSMQLQGEVQEIALEQLLSNTYPFDTIKEIPKGVQGADCIQTVINAQQQVCGSIIYESKRTKAFSNDWISKLKEDQIRSKADIAILATQALPKNIDTFGEMDGVWICEFNAVKILSHILRESLIKIQTVKLVQENKGDKMELLYNYLTSNEFTQNVARIIEYYDAMRVQLNKEKKIMHVQWAEREKQIWAVQENITTLFGSIKGIAGKTLETLDTFSLDHNS